MTVASDEVTLNHNPVTETLFTQIVAGIKEIDTANETLLGEESGTPVRDIDKAFKSEDVSDIPADLMKQWNSYVKAQEKAKSMLTEVRNAYRTEVLGEAEKAESSISDEDKDVLRENRKVIMEAVNFLAGYAKTNGLADVAEWASSLEIPQVGRKATSSVGGAGVKRPRVFVTVNGTKHDSFTKAALAISSKDKKYSAGDLAEAWNSNLGESDGSFEFDGFAFEVEAKNKD